MPQRKSYIVSGHDLRIRPRNRPGPGEPPDPEYPGEPNPEHPEEPGYPEYPEDPPDYEKPGHPEIPEVPPIPRPPGLYIGPTKYNPIIPVPPEPEEGEGKHIKLPPGAIWPKPYGRVAGHYVAFAYIPGHGWRYIVIDPDAWPSWEKPEVKPPTVEPPPGGEEPVEPDPTRR